MNGVSMHCSQGHLMSKITCYRIDLRADLKAGEIVTSPGDHIDRLPESLKAAEMRLRGRSKENEQMRAESLYAFTDFVWSKKYFLGKKGCLYELEVDEADLVHAADMMLVNQISEAQDDDSAKALVEQYWAGARGNGERVELLATKAVVKRLLHTPADKLMLKKQLYK